MEIFNTHNLRTEININIWLHAFYVHELVLGKDDPVSSELSKWQ